MYRMRAARICDANDKAAARELACKRPAYVARANDCVFHLNPPWNKLPIQHMVAYSTP
jgi:hypothetical protein